MPSIHEYVDTTKRKMWDYINNGGVTFRKDVIHTLNMIASDYDCTIFPLADVLIVKNSIGEKMSGSEAEKLAVSVYNEYYKTFGVDLGFGLIVIDGKKSTNDLINEYNRKILEKS